jgi:hypothetical protein
MHTCNTTVTVATNYDDDRLGYNSFNVFIAEHDGHLIGQIMLDAQFNADSNLHKITNDIVKVLDTPNGTYTVVVDQQFPNMVAENTLMPWIIK